MKYGLAGWPLRVLRIDDIREAFRMSFSPVIEIPKDLLGCVSRKEIFSVCSQSGKTITFAATTDFTNLSGLCWDDYQRYLDIQIAEAKLLKCIAIRVFLNANSKEELELAILRLTQYAQCCSGIEFVVETHGGFESTELGFEFCLLRCNYKFVVDLANIFDRRLIDIILSGSLSSRISYFHVRNLPGYIEESRLLEWEAQAIEGYPRHVFLWEPKRVSGNVALEIFRRYYELTE